MAIFGEGGRADIYLWQSKIDMIIYFLFIFLHLLTLCVFATCLKGHVCVMKYLWGSEDNLLECFFFLPQLCGRNLGIQSASEASVFTSWAIPLALFCFFDPCEINKSERETQTHTKIHARYSFRFQYNVCSAVSSTGGNVSLVCGFCKLLS